MNHLLQNKYKQKIKEEICKMRVFLSMFLAFPIWYIIFDTETYWAIPVIFLLQLLAGFDYKISGK